LGQILSESGYLTMNAGEDDYIPATSVQSSPESLSKTGVSAYSDIHPALSLNDPIKALSIGFPGREKSIVTLFSYVHLPTFSVTVCLQPLRHTPL
jgi:hypothetical protein